MVTKDLADSFFFTTETISDHLTAPGYDGGDWRCDGDIGPAPGYTCRCEPIILYPLYTLYTPFIAVHTPIYTRYRCIYTIHTPNTPLNTLYTP